jgi:hypothetical protein
MFGTAGAAAVQTEYAIPTVVQFKKSEKRLSDVVSCFDGSGSGVGRSFDLGSVHRSNRNQGALDRSESRLAASYKFV